jgi:hypothetical protein
MGKWTVADDTNELFIVESLPDGSISLCIPPAEPRVINREQAEQVRLYIGTAIASVYPRPS